MILFQTFAQKKTNELQPVLRENLFTSTPVQALHPGEPGFQTVLSSLKGQMKALDAVNPRA